MAIQERQEKRYKAVTYKDLNRDRQLSSLFSIISNNLLVATEVLSGANYEIESVQKLDSLSRKAKMLAKELISGEKSKEDLAEKISYLKHKMLELVADLNEELSKLDIKKSSNGDAVEDIILARRLLRESQRGLITIQD